MRQRTKVTLVLTALVGLSTATEFERCSLLGKDRNDLCFKTKMAEVIVKMGPVGTDDDVTLEVCSDRDSTECCKTPALKSLLSDDWSANDEETWGTRYFGPCKDKVFTVKRGLTVTLSKAKSSRLEVRNITIDTVSPNKKDKSGERFVCPRPFNLGGKDSTKVTQVCKVGPYSFDRIQSAVATMGRNSNDGTDDDVTMKICSDVDLQDCCEKELSSTFSDDWKRGKTETWDRGDFGDCGKKLFKVQDQPIVSIYKDGKDDLVVTSFAFTFDEIDVPVRRTKYTCGGFKLEGDCKKKEVCTHTFRRCTPQSTSLGGSGGTGSSGSTGGFGGSGSTGGIGGSGSSRPSSGSNRPSFLGTTTTTSKKGLLSSILG